MSVNRRYPYHRNQRHRPSRKELPKAFGIAEALGVSFLALGDAFNSVISSIIRFNQIRNSVHYNI